MHDKLIELSVDTVKETYHQELHVLTSKDNGWHFGASNATTKQMEDFSLKEMAWKIESSTPWWWKLFGLFLNDEKAWLQGSLQRDEMDDVEMDDTPPLDSVHSDDYWNDVDEIDLEGIISVLAKETSTRLLPKDRRKRQCLASTMMVCAILVQ